MIRRISIQSYRSCLDTTFDLHPNLSVLIGPNSSGKTNILNALLMLRKLVEEEQYHYRRDEEPSGQCKLKVWFDVGGKTVILTAGINILTDENNNDIVLSSRQQWYAKDFTGNAQRIQLPLWVVREFGRTDKREHFLRLSWRHSRILGRRVSFAIPESLIEPLDTIVADLSEMRYYSASQFTNPAHCPLSIEIEQEGKISRGMRTQHGHAKFLFDLYKNYTTSRTTTYEQFSEIVGPSGIGLLDKIEFKEIPTSSIDYSVRAGGRVTERKREKILVIPKFRIGSNDLSPNQLSEGTFKTITLLFYLITEASKFLLVEEPEVCVHHGLLSSIIELVKTYSSDKQIVLSTHSDFVLDKVEPQNVYKVINLTGQGTKVAHITKAMSRKELAALRQYLEMEGNLGEYWKHGGLE